MKKPWEIRPEFSEIRLSAIAAQIATARDAVAERRDSLSGDNPWVHGCRAYGWAGTAIASFAVNQDWLNASMNMNIFDGRIENIPFTISRDDPSEISERTQKKIMRLNDAQADFGFEHIWVNEQVRFCFVIDANSEEVFGISCIGVLNTGLTVARHDVDLLEAVTNITDLSTITEPPDEIPEFEPDFKTGSVTEVANENTGEDIENDNTKGTAE